MSQNNLYKGFEVELFTGSLNSHIGISAEIEKKFPWFCKRARYQKRWIHNKTWKRLRFFI